MANCKKAVQTFRKRLEALRILDTDFPRYDSMGNWLGRKRHFLLTYTPKNLHLPEEDYQLSESQILELLRLARKVLKIAERHISERKLSK